MTKILVTGASGQLGQELAWCAVGNNDYELVSKSSSQVDITKQDSIDRSLQDIKPMVVINCAAYTAVDQAESEGDKVWQVNHQGAENLARLCKEAGVRLVHISTDFVFDGSHNFPYDENHPTSPLGIYGQSKEEGEKAVLSYGGLVLRTSWLYSVFGNNFVKTILRLAREREELGIVADQVGSPTNARDLARALLILARAEKPAHQLYHFCNNGLATWYDLAAATVDLAAINCRLKPISTVEYPTPAKRPVFSALNNRRIVKEFSLPERHWLTSLRQAVGEIKKL